MSDIVNSAQNSEYENNQNTKAVTLKSNRSVSEIF
jgi:hypothetical protein